MEKQCNKQVDEYSFKPQKKIDYETAYSKALELYNKSFHSTNLS